MTILDAAFWAVCLVLVASGATKLVDPTPFAGALSALDPRSRDAVHGGTVPSGRVVGTVVGAIEVVVGLAGLVVGGRAVAAVAAVAYACFAVVVLVARRRGLASCGCFGARSGPPSLLHAVINAGSALACAAAAVTGPVALADGLDGLGVAVAVGTVLAVLTVASLIVVADTR